MQLYEFDPKNFFSLLLMFISGCFGWNSPEPIVVSAPTIITQQVQQKDSAFYIYMGNDHSIWYKTDTTYKGEKGLKWDTKKKKVFDDALSVYKEEATISQKRPQIYIVGEKDVRYNDFELVINELKKYELLSYQLITVEE